MFGKNKKVNDVELFNFKEDKINNRKPKKEKKNKKNKKIKNEEIEHIDNNKFNADNEIIIGLTRIPEPNKNVPKNKKKKRTSYKKKKKSSKKEKVLLTILLLIFLIICAIVVTFFSPIFNIKEIYVNGNERVSQEQIISLSQIKINQNTFKLNKNQIKQNIKQNAYIEDVEIKRIFPDKVELNIIERVPTIMLKLENGFCYLNNQGYMLEISEQKLEKVSIEGYDTKKENIKVGGRLCNADLQKLEDLLKILEICNSNDILNLVTTANIEKKNNYILNLETQEKKVYIGDTTNLTTKILYVKRILEKEKEYKGEIFVNMDLNQSNPYFRESV